MKTVHGYRNNISPCEPSSSWNQTEKHLKANSSLICAKTQRCLFITYVHIPKIAARGQASIENHPSAFLADEGKKLTDFLWG